MNVEDFIGAARESAERSEITISTGALRRIVYAVLAELYEQEELEASDELIKAIQFEAAHRSADLLRRSGS